MIVEICANSFESAVAAQNAGADRIELCTQLAVGGLTPSPNLIKKVMSELFIPVHVLIRPRKGNFCYSKKELNIMKNDIEFCKISLLSFLFIKAPPPKAITLSFCFNDS